MLRRNFANSCFLTISLRVQGGGVTSRFTEADVPVHTFKYNITGFREILILWFNSKTPR